MNADLHLIIIQSKFKQTEYYPMFKKYYIIFAKHKILDSQV